MDAYMEYMYIHIPYRYKIYMEIPLIYPILIGHQTALEKYKYVCRVEWNTYQLVI